MSNVRLNNKIIRHNWDCSAKNSDPDAGKRAQGSRRQLTPSGAPKGSPFQRLSLRSIVCNAVLLNGQTVTKSALRAPPTFASPSPVLGGTAKGCFQAAVLAAASSLWSRWESWALYCRKSQTWPREDLLVLKEEEDQKKEKKRKKLRNQHDWMPKHSKIYFLCFRRNAI